VSILDDEAVTCECGTQIVLRLADSVNAVRHPHLRQQVLDRALHGFACSECGHAFTVEKELLYIDFERAQFIGVFPQSERERERECGEQLLQAFQRAMRDEAPQMIRERADSFLVRICFGYEELREKLIIDDARLSDLIVEALKLQLIGADGWFLDHGVRTLRLESVDERGALAFVPEWPDAPPDDWERRPIAAERALYDALLPHLDELAARRELALGPHVSLLRLIDWSARRTA
jgi:hypothetical protein